MKRLLSTLAAGALAALTFSFSVQASTASPVFHSAATGNNFVAYDLLKTPAQAKTFCSNKGGHLLVLKSHAHTVEVVNALALLLPSAISTDADIYYQLGASVPANAANPVTVTGQDFYLDTNYVQDGLAVPSAVELTLTLTAYNPAFSWLDVSSNPRRFLCEFEDTPF